MWVYEKENKMRKKQGTLFGTLTSSGEVINKSVINLNKVKSNDPFGRSSPLIGGGLHTDLHKSALEERSKKNIEISKTKLKELRRRRRTGDISLGVRR
jgi:hypothetical protein